MPVTASEVGSQAKPVTLACGLIDGAAGPRELQLTFREPLLAMYPVQVSEES